MATANQKPAEVVRFYADEDRRLPKTVEGRLKAARAELSEQLATCGAMQDPMWMKHVVGQIAGIDRAIQECQEAYKELFGNN